MSSRLFLILIACVLITPMLACDPKTDSGSPRATSGQASESDPVLQGLDAARRAYIQGRNAADIYVD